MMVTVSDVGAMWVFLQWTPAPFDGNSPIESFIITADPDIRITVNVSTTASGRLRYLR